MINRSLLILFAFCLVACGKTVDPPSDPIIGEWTIHHIIYSGFVKALNTYNRVDSNSTHIGLDTYVFKSDHTYLETFAGNEFYSVDSTHLSQGTESGSWALGSEDKPFPLLKLKRVTPVSSSSSPDYFGRLILANEFTVGYNRPYVLLGYPPLTYYEEIHYRRKN